MSIKKTVFITSILAAVPYFVKACKCLSLNTVQETYRYTDIIFTATVLEILPPSKPIDTSYDDNDKMIISGPIFGYPKRLLTHTIYKGIKLQDTLTLAANESNCELHLQVGESYLIYGTYENGQIHSNKCTRSGILNGHPDIPYLNQKIKKARK